MKLLSLFSFWVLFISEICFSQRELFRVEDSTQITECYLNDTIIKKIKPLLDDALYIMTLFKNKDYKVIEKEFKNTFGNAGYPTKDIKKKTNWAFALINKYGIPENTKIKFECSVPISWFLANKKTESGMLIDYTISFKFEYPDDEVKEKNNAIAVFYSQYNSKLQNHYTRTSIDFFDAKAKSVIQEMIDEFTDKKN